MMQLGQTTQDYVLVKYIILKDLIEDSITKMHTLSSYTRSKPNLSFSGDGTCGDSHCVDSSIGILMDLDVRFLLSGFHIPCSIKQVQHFLIVQLQNRKKPLIALFLNCRTVENELLPNPRTCILDRHIVITQEDS